LIYRANMHKLKQTKDQLAECNKENDAMSESQDCNEKGKYSTLYFNTMAIL